MSDNTGRVLLVIITALLGGLIGLGLKYVSDARNPDRDPSAERLDRVCGFVRAATSDAADLAESDQPERREAGIVTLKLIKNALTECVR